MEMDKTIGAITWFDLTVEQADDIRDFYKSVVGWKSTDISMGEYNDYCVVSPSDEVVRAGICHKRGKNDYFPNAWIMYVNVADLNASVEAVRAGGGEVVGDIRKMGNSVYCIIKDPAGAYLGLFQHGES